MMENANKAVVYVSTSRPEVLTRYAKHGNPAVRRAAERMLDIRGMADQETARQRQTAGDALFYLPFPQIEECVRLWEGR